MNYKNSNNSINIAVIPIGHEEHSSVDKMKNFVDTKVLLELKIDQLKRKSKYDKIYVSSISLTDKIVADKLGVDFIFRNSDLFNGNRRWSDVIYSVANSATGFNPTIVWIKKTNNNSIMAGKSSYANPDYFIYDTLINVSLVNGSDSLSERNTTYHWGVLHETSFDIKKLYRLSGALFIARKRDLLKVRSTFVAKPKMQIMNNTSSMGGVSDVESTMYKLNKLSQWKNVV